MIDRFRAAAPSRPPGRDWFAPAVVAGSLFGHAALVAPLVWGPPAEAARPPIEIPIEVVQEPPKPETKPAAKPAQAKQAQAKPAQAKAAQTKAAQAPTPPEPQRQARPKPPAEKPAAPKPLEPKPPEPKPLEPKAAERKAEDRKPAETKAEEPKQAAKTPEPAKPSDSKVAERMARLIGPMPAMAMPSLTGGDNPLDDAVSYRQLVLSQVARQKRDGRHDGIPGHAVIAFAIGDHGEVTSCEVREKSVDPALDAEGMAMVRRGAPYPPPPPGAERAFTFGLAFRTLS